MNTFTLLAILIPLGSAVLFFLSIYILVIKGDAEIF